MASKRLKTPIYLPRAVFGDRLATIVIAEGEKVISPKVITTMDVTSKGKLPAKLTEK